MENQLIWKDEFSIGVKIIDEEHQKLFETIARLFVMRDQEKRSRMACLEGIKYLKAHALKHFDDEEKYMELVAYDEIEMHKRLHRGFRDNTLPALERELEREDYSPASVDHFLSVCTGWLIGHILAEDRAITGGKMSKWVDLLPEQEVEAIKQVILKLLKDMFQVEAHVVTDSYGGERFGNGVYYRLVYGREKDEKKWEILLAFEERSLVNTVGKMMGIRTDKLDMVLLNAVRYTASQFVRRVMDHYPSIESYEMVEENLLTYEQFSGIFERKQPQVSLLFDTTAGYFSYCIIAPHLLEDGIGTPIDHTNAVSEVEKYLLEKEKNKKLKILVVDDSSTIRLGMKRLLENDYDVAEVHSGVSAIRAISLDKPDLVLLDYEMPVCDGRHVLEMLRSEKEFSDVSVIFLTTRDDHESVKKVLSLKADGYLLKYLKPTEIKKRIDEFFRIKKPEFFAE